MLALQAFAAEPAQLDRTILPLQEPARPLYKEIDARNVTCLLYTSDAADERSSVDLGGRRIIKKKKHQKKK